MVTDSIQYAFFKIPKTNDISELESVFLLHYRCITVLSDVKYCKPL